MADLSKEKLGSILAQAEVAANKIRAHWRQLLQFQRQLDKDPPSDAAGLKRMKEFAAGDIEKFLYDGLDACGRDLTAVLTMAAANGVRLALNSSFPVMSGNELCRALLAAAKVIPTLPTTQTEAFSRVEAALFCVKLAQEHLLLRCAEHIRRIGNPDPPASRQTATTSGAETGGLPAKEKAPQESGSSLRQAPDYFLNAVNLVTIALEHVDLTAASMSSFLDPEDGAKPSDVFST